MHAVDKSFKDMDLSTVFLCMEYIFYSVRYCTFKLNMIYLRLLTDLLIKFVRQICQVRINTSGYQEQKDNKKR